MKIISTESPIEEIQTEALVFPIFEGDKNFLQNVVKTTANLTENDFSGKLYETFLIPAGSSTPKILLVGAGKKGEFDARIGRNVAGAAARRLLKNKVKKIAFDAKIYSQPSLIIEGVVLGEFDPGVAKTGKEKPGKFEELMIIGKFSSSEIKKAQSAAETTNWVRALVAQPANLLTPSHLVEEAKKIAREQKLKIEVYDEKQAAREGMGAFLGIAKGSHEPSYMVSLKYLYGKDAPTLGVVGKGITFDSGGISIKPSEKMHDMKMDMAGAAATIGFMKLVGILKPKINVVGVTPLTENLPGGGALKPGDVVKASNGKSIEVINTDAEGRVVLSDGLLLAQKQGAQKIVDLATLTGAAIVALGYEATAILGNNQEFIDQVIQSGKEVGERMWQLPLYPEHKEFLRSEVADLANVPPSRGAGVIAGAVFLQEFIDNKVAWAHLDIAGTAWNEGEKPYLAKGPTGVGVQTLLKLIDQL
ncbi:MAG TPA: leucyl aminopeptidase [Candidatus Saccharimonadales bacterium]|nr:leucyl aminopeptidase [Candidatus Saccharimonadales bacterium]